MALEFSHVNPEALNNLLFSSEMFPLEPFLLQTCHFSKKPLFLSVDNGSRDHKPECRELMATRLVTGTGFLAISVTRMASTLAWTQNLQLTPDRSILDLPSVARTFPLSGLSSNPRQDKRPGQCSSHVEHQRLGGRDVPPVSQIFSTIHCITIRRYQQERPPEKDTVCI